MDEKGRREQEPYDMRRDVERLKDGCVEGNARQGGTELLKLLFSLPEA